MKFTIIKATSAKSDTPNRDYDYMVREEIATFESNTRPNWLQLEATLKSAGIDVTGYSRMTDPMTGTFEFNPPPSGIPGQYYDLPKYEVRDY